MRPDHILKVLPKKAKLHGSKKKPTHAWTLVIRKIAASQTVRRETRFGTAGVTSIEKAIKLTANEQ